MVGASGSNQTANVTTGGLIFNAATNTLTVGTYNGSGAGLTSIPGANVSGTVASATQATNSSNVNGTAQTLGLANSGTTVGNGGQAGPQAGLGQGGGAAVISLHRPGAYAVNMGLDTDNVFKIGGWSDGSNTYRFQVASGGAITATSFSGVSTTAKYADLAELYVADAEYAPGTVLVFGGTQEVTISTATHDHRVAGVVSTNPAHTMNSALQGEHTVVVALAGRVPVSVVGNINPGDQVVSSDQAGVAEALDLGRYQPGVIIGKALQKHTGDSVGVIEVVVGRL
jgi:hypothetical protein